MASQITYMTGRTAGFITACLLTGILLAGCEESGTPPAQPEQSSQSKASPAPQASTVKAQTPSTPPAQTISAPRTEVADGMSAWVDPDQTMYRINNYTQVAESGPDRGKTIHYYKCRVCHNNVADDPGPPLDNLFERPILMTGDPVNDDTVAAKIRQGGPNMPGFTNMTDSQMAALVSYLRSDACCDGGRNLNPLPNPKYKADTNKWSVPTGQWGGPTGVVRSNDGDLLEGMKVQLVAPNGVRLTVFTNEEGEYEFPEMQAGAYMLRIATPAPFKAYRREGVRVSGDNPLPDIVLELVPNPGGESYPEQSGRGALFGALPPTQEIISQLSGSELLWNLPGTDQEKSLFARTCGNGCHSYQQIFRNRFTEQGWRAMVHRMMGYAQAGLVNRRASYAYPVEEADAVVKWLAKVRGPNSVDQPMRMFPRVTGKATELVITEYEMPYRMLGIHDTYGDADGNIWYTSHFAAEGGVLDPRTGIIKEVVMPPVSDNGLPGTHTVMVDSDRGYAWYTQRWDGAYLVRYNMATDDFTTFDTIGGSNFIIDKDGYLWIRGRDWTDEEGNTVEGVYRIEPENAEITDVYPLKKNPVPYQSAISSDGRFWAGGTPPTTGANTAEMLDVESGTMYEINSGDQMHSAARGGFEPNGKDAWFGGRDGFLVEVVNRIDEGEGVSIRTYEPPGPYYPYTTFYTAMPDRNGEVWAGILHGRGFVRYNQETREWTKYQNPEPSAVARYTWVDDSTDPVTVWYPDFHTGLIVRIQPRPVGD